MFISLYLSWVAIFITFTLISLIHYAIKQYFKKDSNGFYKRDIITVSYFLFLCWYGMGNG
jgi:hypothetical protein